MSLKRFWQDTTHTGYMHKKKEDKHKKHKKERKNKLATARLFMEGGSALIKGLAATAGGPIRTPDTVSTGGATAAAEGLAAKYKGVSQRRPVRKIRR